MNITIKPLTPELADDYISFFSQKDSYADKEWSWCYCQEYYLTNAWFRKNISRLASLDSAAMARERVINGQITGYLAYQDGHPVGWCAANGKKNYPRLVERRELWSKNEPDKTLAIVCFAVSRPCRRQGVASALLEYCIADARNREYEVIEAYPQLDKNVKGCRKYHGFASMYEQRGFETVTTLEDCNIMRKSLIDAKRADK
jgi:ribosomal protein S18 acetylase RimI-like enzyme